MRHSFPRLSKVHSYESILDNTTARPSIEWVHRPLAALKGQQSSSDLWDSWCRRNGQNLQSRSDSNEQGPSIEVSHRSEEVRTSFSSRGCQGMAITNGSSVWNSFPTKKSPIRNSNVGARHCSNKWERLSCEQGRTSGVSQGIALPNLEAMEKKVQEIEESKQYVLKNTDITKIVEEKNRFRKTPINYAMSKNELLKEIVSRATIGSWYASFDD